MFRSLRTVLLAGVGLCGALAPNVAQAHGRFSFSLGVWGPPPVYVGPPCYDVYYYRPRPVYVVEPPPPPVYVVPPAASTRPARTRLRDTVLVKIGELHSNDSNTREEAAEWLGEARDPRAVRPLIEVLEHDPDHDVREQAAKALGRIGSLDAEQALRVAGESDPANDVRRAASKALTRLAKEASKGLQR